MPYPHWFLTTGPYPRFNSTHFNTLKKCTIEYGDGDENSLISKEIVLSPALLLSGKYNLKIPDLNFLLSFTAKKAKKPNLIYFPYPPFVFV